MAPRWKIVLFMFALTASQAMRHPLQDTTQLQLPTASPAALTTVAAAPAENTSNATTGAPASDIPSPLPPPPPTTTTTLLPSPSGTVPVPGPGAISSALPTTTQAAVAAAASAAAAVQVATVTDYGTYTLPSGVVVLLAPPLAPPTPPAPAPADQFVQRTGAQLVLGGKPFRFTGINAFWWIDAASWGAAWGRREVVETMVAAQRLGMRVARTWAFNSRLPAAPGVYDPDQFQALDFIVYAAQATGLRLILALGNFWNAFKAPEDYVYWGEGMGPHTLLDFYTSARTRALYQAHMTTIFNRVNSFTGVAYRDDPTILGWDVLNEPRCPGCEDAQLQSIAVTWMSEMTTLAKQVAPKQLVALGTEGFFTRDTKSKLHLTNPGPGAQCEGEDWLKIVALPTVDFATLHVYERHMEWQPVPPSGRTYIGDPDWVYCDFACYIQWLVRYIKAHQEALAASSNKPLVIEEFGLTWWRADVRDRRVLFLVVGQLLASSHKEGSNLAGALLWLGAHNNTADQDGYNVRIDGWPKPSLPSQPPSLLALPPILPYLQSWLPTEAEPQGNAAPTQAVDQGATTAGPPATPSPSPPSQPGGVVAVVQGTEGPPAGAQAVTGRKSLSLSLGQQVAGPLADPQHPAVMGTPAARHSPTRHLSYQSDKLDGFRRGWQRGSCAHEASRTWRPPLAWANASAHGANSDVYTGAHGGGTAPDSDGSGLPEAAAWRAVPLAAMRAYAYPLQEVDVLKWAADQVKA